MHASIKGAQRCTRRQGRTGPGCTGIGLYARYRGTFSIGLFGAFWGSNKTPFNSFMAALKCTKMPKRIGAALGHNARA